MSYPGRHQDCPRFLNSAINVNTGSRLLIVVFFAAGLVVGWGVTRFVPLPWIGAPASSEGDGADGGTPVDGELEGRDVAALGRLEPAGDMIAVSALPGDRLKTLAVAEGDFVAAGDVIGQLDSYRLRELEVESIDARLREAAARETAETNLADSRIIAAELAVEQARSKSLELESQKQQVEVLRSSLALEQSKLDKIADVSHDLISDEEKQQQALLVQKLTAELSAAETMVKQLEQTSQLALRAANADLEAAKTAKEQIKATMPTESLKVAREVAVEQRDRSLIKAPIDGTVLAVYTHPGEHIANQPVLQMADLRQMVCVAEVYETDVRLVKKGQRAEIHSKVFPPDVNKKGLHGTVERVGDIIASAQLNPLDPFARSDRHVVEVRIKLDAESAVYAAQLVNLQVDVTIHTQEGASQVAVSDVSP
ncbi:MAG: HlyD family efflux transporter periplasmic adaptor subunit [Pirellulaceae bacterium]